MQYSVTTRSPGGMAPYQPGTLFGAEITLLFGMQPTEEFSTQCMRMRTRCGVVANANSEHEAGFSRHLRETTNGVTSASRAGSSDFVTRVDISYQLSTREHLALKRFDPH